MKTFKHKFFIILLLVSSIVQSQTYDKKISENFKVNADATIVINATHTDIDIETWNKNEVSIEAVMEVEGLSKKEAEKLMKRWKFEALANKDKVKINSYSGNYMFTFDGDFEFDIPELNIDLPQLELLELAELPEIVIPEINFEFPNIEIPEFDFPEIEIPEIDFDYELYKKDSTYLKKYKLQIEKVMQKFKNSDWKKKMDSMRNSKEFKDQMKAIKEANKKMTIELKELRNSKEFQEQMEQARKVAEEYKMQVLENKDMWRAQAQAAKEAAMVVHEEMLKNEDLIRDQVAAAKEASEAVMLELKRLKAEGKLDSLHHYKGDKYYGENVYILNNNDKDSKVKVRKYLKIKVPKNAKFDLNVRHGKLKVPNSNKKMSANVSYGNFIAGDISGMSNVLNLTNSPVDIDRITQANITLKNVPNATFGTFSNGNLFSNSSDVIINELGKEVALSQKFGALVVGKLSENFSLVNLILDYAKADLNFSDNNYTYQINSKSSTWNLADVLTELSNTSNNGVVSMNGYLTNKSSVNKVLITGVYSTVTLN